MRRGAAPAHHVDLPVEDGGGEVSTGDEHGGALSPAVAAAVEDLHVRGADAAEETTDDVDVVF